MGAHQIAIAQINPGRRDHATHHLLGPVVVILIVRTAARTVGVHQRRLPAASGPPATLCVIGRGRRHIAQIHHIQLRDIDAQLHRRRTEQQGQIAGAKPIFAVLTVFRGDLSGMLPCFQAGLQVDEVAVALDEIAIHFRRDFTGFDQARRVKGANLARARQPAQRSRVDLIAGGWRIRRRDRRRPSAAFPGSGHFTTAHLLDDAVAFQGQQQKADNRIHVFAPEVLARRRIRLEKPTQIAAIATVG